MKKESLKDLTKSNKKTYFKTNQKINKKWKI